MGIYWSMCLFCILLDKSIVILLALFLASSRVRCLLPKPALPHHFLSLAHITKKYMNKTNSISAKLLFLFLCSSSATVDITLQFFKV